MAGDWFPMRADLMRDPAVVATADKLNLDRFQVVGRLFFVWAWAQEQSPDGHLPGVTYERLDDDLRVKGFCQQLESVGWMAFVDGGILIPNFNKWMSRGAKKRLKNTETKRRGREASRHKPVTKVSPREGDKSKTTGQDSTVQNRIDPEIIPQPPSLLPAEPPNTTYAACSEEAAALAQLWCYHLTRRKKGYPADHLDDMRPEFQNLLNLGLSAEHLREQLEAKTRDRGEHFWQFKDRVKKRTGTASPSTGDRVKEFLRRSREKNGDN
jgi:hypothetical protein